MKKYIILFFKFIINNIDDILILGGSGVFITALFLFVSTFAGMIGLSVMMVLIGLVLSRIPRKQ